MDDLVLTVVKRLFQARSSEDKMFVYRAYEESTLKRVAIAVMVLLISVFLLLPLAVLAYFSSNVTLAVCLVLPMAMLLFFLADSIERSEGRVLLLVFGYLAVFAMFLTRNS
jgi:uncharacterized membrane protein YGL010W